MTPRPGIGTLRCLRRLAEEGACAGEGGILFASAFSSPTSSVELQPEIETVSVKDKGTGKLHSSLRVLLRASPVSDAHAAAAAAGAVAASLREFRADLIVFCIEEGASSPPLPSSGGSAGRCAAAASFRAAAGLQVPCVAIFEGGAVRQRQGGGGKGALPALVDALAGAGTVHK